MAYILPRLLPCTFRTWNTCRAGETGSTSLSIPIFKKLHPAALVLGPRSLGPPRGGVVKSSSLILRGFALSSFPLSSIRGSLIYKSNLKIFWQLHRWDLSSLARDQTCTPVLEVQSLNHWTARGVPTSLISSEML